MDVFKSYKGPLGGNTIKCDFDKCTDNINTFNKSIDGFFMKTGNGSIRKILSWCKEHPYDKRTVKVLDIDKVQEIFNEYIEGVEALLKEYKAIDCNADINDEIYDKLKRATASYSNFINQLFAGNVKVYDSAEPLMQEKPIKEAIYNIGYLIDYKDRLVELNNTKSKFIIQDTENQRYNQIYRSIVSVYVSSLLMYNNKLMLSVMELMKEIENAIGDQPNPYIKARQNTYQVF